MGLHLMGARPLPVVEYLPIDEQLLGDYPELADLMKAEEEAKRGGQPVPLDAADFPG